MSGHSKWDNIKRRKGAQDQKRGKIFSKISRLIIAAVKEGGSDDANFNPRLRLAIERARSENMPNDNINRAIVGAAKSNEDAKEFVLEGYGPGGVAVMIEALSDNHQRTVQELKNIFQKGGGSLSEPGAVAFQFEKKGLLEIEKVAEEKMLSLIDAGADDFEEIDGKTVVWASASALSLLELKATELGIEVKRSDVVMKPINKVSSDKGIKAKAADFLETVADHDDVQRVFSNLDTAGL
ncbi:MAG: YebC/PmpR family DNA-binding transcriptional regulator [Patescibacteria group bacterium]|nr:YebC/PmpR family DNA-binding transcriptional regulator [Patescibacteria group bacterium]